MAGGFNEMYEGVPPWDIGRPQPVFVHLADEGAIRGDVLDVGCGTGENALFLALRGFRVVGLDGAPRAIAKARAKASRRGSPAEFVVGDALKLDALKRTFDTVIDSGLFHTFEDKERAKFVRSLRGALRAGGSYFMLAFSEHEPGAWGPRRVTQREIRATFKEGWTVRSIEEASFAAQLQQGGEAAHAWLSSIVRQ
jgi:SAM-dependent methyltransferase